MSKSKNNSIVFALKMLSLFAFGVLFTPAIASADMPGYVTAYNTTSFNNNVVANNNGNYNNYQQPVYTYNNPPVYNNPAPVYNTYQDPNNIPTVYSSSTAKTKTVSKAKTTVAKTTSNNEATVGNLAANALFGSNGFLPSGLIQWLIIAIIILVLMILARRAFGSKQNYDAAPMKHA